LFRTPETPFAERSKSTAVRIRRRLPSAANQRRSGSADTCHCVWGGTITTVNPGQTIVNDA
jgi:hypothetical protein